MTQAAALSLLFVDDESEALACLCTLSSIRYPQATIHSAEDGHAALRCFQQHSPDIVVTDISMPEMDGISMAAEMKALDPTASIIALTAHLDTRFLLRSIEIGIDHYLLKPLVCEKLFSVIDQKIALKNEHFARLQTELALEKSQNELQAINLQLEQRVRERTADLQAMVRELESFSYSVSHDLRAPLRHINSFSAIVLEDFAKELPVPVQGYLDKICRASNRMGELIDHLLELSRVGRTELEFGPVNLSEMATSILGGLQETEPERCVKIEVEHDLTVLGDHPLLRQLLENLLGNAWKYTAKKPAASIRFGRTDVSGEPTFFVKDDGAGFDMQYKDNLFVAFQRLHGTDFHGDGIGLATAQRIVHRHGGAIWAGGEVDRGATFYFTLPTSLPVLRHADL